MVFPLLILGGALYWALKTPGESKAAEASQASYIESERQKLETEQKMLLPKLERYRTISEFTSEVAQRPADRRLRSDFFLFARCFLVSTWLERYEERGHFIEPEYNEEPINPVDWAEFPEYFDIAIQPRLSSEIEDLIFILTLPEKYPCASKDALFGAILNTYCTTLATLDTIAGTMIYNRYRDKYGTGPDPDSDAYYKIRDKVNDELCLNKGFEEMLGYMYGNASMFLDGLAKSLSV